MLLLRLTAHAGVSGVGHNGRFKKALVRTLLVNGAEWDDESVSPVGACCCVRCWTLCRG